MKIPVQLSTTLLGALLLLSPAPVEASPTPSPHEGHHGFPGAEFNSSVIHSNVTRPQQQQTSHSHSHAHGGTPLLTLNETQILLGHAPDLLSYFAWDVSGERQGFKSGWGDDAFDIVVYQGKSHGWLMGMHVIFMTAAYFGALPASIVLRSAKHALQPVVHTIFIGLALAGWAVAGMYRKLVPDLYPSSSHSPQSTILLLLTLSISAAEYIPKSIRFWRRFFAHVQGVAERGESVSWSEVVKGWKEGRSASSGYESVKLVGTQEGEGEVMFETEEWANERVASPEGSGSSSPSHQHQGHQQYPHNHHHYHHGTRTHHHHARKMSSQSDFSDASTLHNHHSPTYGGSLEHIQELEDEGTELSPEEPRPTGKAGRALKYLGTARFIWERLAVILAYAMWVSGSAVYTGICRGNYLNGCLAHLIKGSIFFVYGLLTFARYLGAFADSGWAWNRLSASNTRRPPSAELVESAVIFVYGATNTWMERFGAEPGSPYTAKQIQHISIAVMYFFGGAIGIALELGWLGSRGDKEDHDLKGKRRWRPHHQRHEDVDEMDVQPYRASYNPFAALCIGVTGIAMAAHHQTYLFQVQIHTLWGTLLSSYTVARCLTYFFLWLNPPRSTKPSRPPTEALASFLLTAGGLAFISSTEQIGFWAMRTGRDDMMMFANVIVALTFFCFTWMFGVLALKSWAVKRGRVAEEAEASSYFSRHGEEYELGPYGGKMKMKMRLAHGQA